MTITFHILSLRERKGTISKRQQQELDTLRAAMARNGEWE